jgi:O-acetylserine/cysteine efflux transporter
VPPVPMLALSLVIEGPDAIARSFVPGPQMLPALLGLAYTVLIGTLAGSGVWTWLMARHPAGVVAPFSMLVPVVGLSASAVLLGEQIGTTTAAGAALVIAGVLWGARRRVPAPPTPEQLTPSPTPTPAPPRSTAGAPRTR